MTLDEFKEVITNLADTPKHEMLETNGMNVPGLLISAIAHVNNLVGVARTHGWGIQPMPSKTGGVVAIEFSVMTTDAGPMVCVVDTREAVIRTHTHDGVTFH